MHRYKFVSIIGFILLMLLSGCATTNNIPDPIDPWEGWNRNMQSFNDGLDDYAIEPIARSYQWIMPGFADRAVTNVFSNINDIGVVINDILQGKFVQSGSDTARFLVNTTIGIGGLIDVGSMIDLPRHKEDFDQTLGFWGVPTGPYLVLPVIGPSSPRGVAGLVGDAAMNPITYMSIYLDTVISPSTAAGLTSLNVIDTRADRLSLEKIATEAAIDRYIFLRDSYLAQRRYLVLDGEVPDDDWLDLDEDFEEDDFLEEDEGFEEDDSSTVDPE